MTTGTELINRFEQFASPQLAESWDHVGLQIGNPDRPIQKLMTTLDVRPEIVREAIDQQVDQLLTLMSVILRIKCMRIY